MDVELRQAIATAIESYSGSDSPISNINLEADGTGTISYASNKAWVDPSSPVAGYSFDITDEELVRAYLLFKLSTKYEYKASPDILEIERVYKAVGRPIGKGGRVDVLVRTQGDEGAQGNAFLFIECKAPR